MRTVHLSLSDFAWLLDDCPRCFWLKSRGLTRPKDNLPKVFRHIDHSMKEAYDAEALRQIGIPAKAINRKHRVLSAPIVFEEYAVQLVIGGDVDLLAELEDGTFDVADFKSTDPDRERMAKFRRQLHSYQRALEYPAKGEGVEVTRLDLICFDAYAGKFGRAENGGSVAMKGKEVLIPLEIDRVWFMGWLNTIAGLVGSDDMPGASDVCATCLHHSEVNRYEADLARRRQAVA